MKKDIEIMKRHILKNKQEIVDAYNICVEKRKQVIIVNEIFNKIVEKILLENNFNVRFGYAEVIECQVIKNIDYVCFIADEEIEIFSKLVYDEIKDIPALVDYFKLEGYDKNVGLYQARAIDHYECDKKLAKLVRAYSDKPFTNYDLDVLEKEFLIIGKIIKMLK